MAQWVRSLDLTTRTSLSPIRRGFTPCFVNYKKGCTRFEAASDKVYQLLAQGRWFSPGTLTYSTTKTGRHDIAEILLKVALKHQKSKKNNINLHVHPRHIMMYMHNITNYLDHSATLGKLEIWTVLDMHCNWYEHLPIFLDHQHQFSQQCSSDCSKFPYLLQMKSCWTSDI